MDIEKIYRNSCAMKPIKMLEKHFTNKFSVIINLHKIMNVCLIDPKLVQAGLFFKNQE